MSRDVYWGGGDRFVLAVTLAASVAAAVFSFRTSHRLALIEKELKQPPVQVPEKKMAAADIQRFTPLGQVDFSGVYASDDMVVVFQKHLGLYNLETARYVAKYQGEVARNYKSIILGCLGSEPQLSVTVPAGVSLPCKVEVKVGDKTWLGYLFVPELLE